MEATDLYTPINKYH